jgi:hypothetical protein
MPLSPDDHSAMILLIEQICSTDLSEIRKGLDDAEQMDRLPPEVIEALQATVRDVHFSVFDVMGEESRVCALLERHDIVPESPGDNLGD